MNRQDRIHAVITGLFYIIAAAAAVMAVIAYGPVLSEPWYLSVSNGFTQQVTLGVVSDLLLVMTAVGTAVMLFPYLRRWNESMALGYLCFRFMEAVLIAIGIVSILALLQLSVHYDAQELVETASLPTIGYLLQSIHRWTSTLGPNWMLGINTFLYSYLLLRTGLAPKPLAIFGMLTALSVFVAGWLELFGIVAPLSAAKAFIALPVGVYEMSLALWLIAKGFNRQNLELLKARPAV